jgi:hypothetical protein
MRVVLFHAIQSQHPRDWLHFRQEAGVIVMQLKNVETLGENVWLINQPDLQMSLDELAKVATRNGISYRTLEFDLEERWEHHQYPI